MRTLIVARGWLLWLLRKPRLGLGLCYAFAQLNHRRLEHSEYEQRQWNRYTKHQQHKKVLLIDAKIAQTLFCPVNNYRVEQIDPVCRDAKLLKIVADRVGKR